MALAVIAGTRMPLIEDQLYYFASFRHTRSGSAFNNLCQMKVDACTKQGKPSKFSVADSARVSWVSQQDFPLELTGFFPQQL